MPFPLIALTQLRAWYWEQENILQAAVQMLALWNNASLETNTYGTCIAVLIVRMYKQFYFEFIWLFLFWENDILGMWCLQGIAITF